MIELPDKFEKDVQGKDTYLVPLIIIDDRIYLSTGKVVLENNYDPLIKSIGTIQESIDIKSKKFKISSVSINLHNYEYNNEILSDKLFSTGAINSRLDIYWKSQSAENLDDCLKVYSGYIVDVRETKDSTLIVSIEDITEKTLHKDLPIRYTPFENMPSKHQNKPIPMVYGVVDRSPCVYMSEGVNQEAGTSEYVIAADDKYIYQTYFPYIYQSDNYAVIKEIPDLLIEQKEGTIFKNVSEVQYIIDSDNRIIIPKSMEISNMTQQDLEEQNSTKNLITFNMAECEMLSENNNYSGGTYTQEWAAGQFGLGLNYGLGGTTKLLSFLDEEGVHFSSSLDNALYIMPKVFEGNGVLWVDSGDISITEDSGYYTFPFEKWVWGDNTAFWQGQTDENGELVYVAIGRNKMNFDLGEFAGQSKLVTELANNLSEENNEEFYNKITLYYDFGCKLEEYSPLNENGGLETYPLIRAMYGDSDNQITEDLWAVGDVSQNTNTGTSGNIGDSAIQDPYVVATFGEKITSIDAELDTTNISIGLTIAEDCAGIMQWFKVGQFKVKREYLIKDFNSFDIFAKVEGRVDNVLGTYTGDPELTVGEYNQMTYAPQMSQQFTGKIKPSIKQPIKQPVKKGKAY